MLESQYDGLVSRLQPYLFHTSVHWGYTLKSESGNHPLSLSFGGDQQAVVGSYKHNSGSGWAGERGYDETEVLNFKRALTPGNVSHG